MRDILVADIRASLGDICEIHDLYGRRVQAEVIATTEGTAQLVTFEHATGLCPGLLVTSRQAPLTVPVGESLLGRVLDGLGQPIDGPQLSPNHRRRSTESTIPHPLTRERISVPVVTGQRAIDGLLTIGRGQRIGLFAGSGVGKSTLLGEIAKHSHSDLNVIALIGERGREVLPFLQDALGVKGRERSVVVVATSDEAPLMKIQAARTALTIAEEFREQGANVLFFLDSLTRFANAHRDVGLARGEVPGQRGYPPSVQATMAALLERLGNDQHGSITGLITILVDGDDFHEPIADAARSILDGHIVLDRRLAALGHFPAINVLQSLSRLFREVTSPQQQVAADELRKVLATYEEVAELIQIGLYQAESVPEVDRAIRKLPAVNRFLQQHIGEVSTFSETLAQLAESCGDEAA